MASIQLGHLLHLLHIQTSSLVSHTRGPFLESPGTFRAGFGWHKMPCILKMETFQVTKLCDSLVFSDKENMLTDQLFRINGLQFFKLLYGPKSLRDFRETGPWLSINALEYWGKFGIFLFNESQRNLMLSWYWHRQIWFGVDDWQRTFAYLALFQHLGVQLESANVSFNVQIKCLFWIFDFFWLLHSPCTHVLVWRFRVRVSVAFLMNWLSSGWK